MKFYATIFGSKYDALQKKYAIVPKTRVLTTYAHILKVEKILEYLSM